MKTSRIDWAKFISEEAKVSPLLKSDQIARHLGISELVVRRSFLRLAKRGMIEPFAKKWFINLLARDFSGRELVNLLRPRSYVSLQTVLREAGGHELANASIDHGRYYRRTGKFGLLESLAHTAAVLPNGNSATLHEIKS
jgi:hypothetical protein